MMQSVVLPIAVVLLGLAIAGEANRCHVKFKDSKQILARLYLEPWEHLSTQSSGDLKSPSATCESLKSPEGISDIMNSYIWRQKTAFQTLALQYHQYRTTDQTLDLQYHYRTTDQTEMKRFLGHWVHVAWQYVPPTTTDEAIVFQAVADDFMRKIFESLKSIRKPVYLHTLDVKLDGGTVYYTAMFEFDEEILSGPKLWNLASKTPPKLFLRRGESPEKLTVQEWFLFVNAIRDFSKPIPAAARGLRFLLDFQTMAKTQEQLAEDRLLSSRRSTATSQSSGGPDERLPGETRQGAVSYQQTFKNEAYSEDILSEENSSPSVDTTEESGQDRLKKEYRDKLGDLSAQYQMLMNNQKLKIYFGKRHVQVEAKKKKYEEIMETSHAALSEGNFLTCALGTLEAQELIASYAEIISEIAAEASVKETLEDSEHGNEEMLDRKMLDRKMLDHMNASIKELQDILRATNFEGLKDFFRRIHMFWMSSAKDKKFHIHHELAKLMPELGEGMRSAVASFQKGYVPEGMGVKQGKAKQAKGAKRRWARKNRNAKRKVKRH